MITAMGPVTQLGQPHPASIFFQQGGGKISAPFWRQVQIIQKRNAQRDRQQV